MKRLAAIGLRAHSGWATLVGVGAPWESLEIIERRRIDLADPRIPGSKQPYHASAGLDIRDAAALLKRCADTAGQMAYSAVHSVLGALRQQGVEIVGCGLLTSSGHPQTTLASTLASHALIHSAEGEHFRKALITAARRCNLPTAPFKEREVEAQGWAVLKTPPDELRRRLVEAGRPLGPPWRQDEKLATLAGWLVLAANLEGRDRPFKGTE